MERGKGIWMVSIAVCLVLAVISPCLYAASPVSGQESVPAAAEDTLSRKVLHRAGAEFHYGYVFPTHAFLKGDNMSGTPVRKSAAVHLKYSFRFGPGTSFGRAYPHTWQGIGLAYNDFFNRSEVGCPVSLYVFQNSRIAEIFPSVSLGYEWNFGASFGWRKHDEISNPYNLVVGSGANAYISLGLFIDWNIRGGWNLLAGADITHYSNGNTSYPNGGVNLLEGRMGMTYSFGQEESLRRAGPDRETPRFSRHFSYDLVLYGALRTKGFFLPGGDPYIVPGKFGVAGLNFNPMYNFSRFFRAGLSLDLQYDESANIKDHIANDNYYDSELKFHRPPFGEQFGAGISVRAELVMPIFSINIGIGRNIICRGEDTDSFYQMLILKAHITRSLFLHAGYQLYRFKDPNNLMLGIGYTFNDRR